MIPNAIDILREHPFVKEVPESFVRMLTGLASEVEFRKEEIIFREGEESKQFYLLLEGSVMLEVTAPGKVLSVMTIGAGEELGWSSVLASDGKHFRARCLTQVRALAFDGEQLRKACQGDARFGYLLMERLLRVVSRRLQATRIQLLDLYSPSRLKPGALG